MDNSPLVSIITSTLNSGELLRQTIQAVRRQNYKNFEFIVVDGDSTDSTHEIIEQSRELITTYIAEPDTGIYDAWNKGLRLAKGKYIAFLGAGDGYLENGLSKMVSCAMANPNAELISSKIVFIRNENLFRVMGAPWSWNKFRHYMTTAHAGSLHSRSLFEKYGAFDTSYKIAGDYELLLRAGKNLQTAYVDEVTATMAWGGVSQINNRCFIESETAKLKNKSVNKFEARLDRYVAEAKRAIRNALGR